MVVSRAARRFVLALLVFGSVAVAPVQAEESAADLARQALIECQAGRTATDRDLRALHFTRGEALGTRAVAADDGSADAHFSLFCNIGEQMRIDGERITSVFGFRRMMTELDRTLEINPEHTDALASKGTLLVRLPRLFGGDQPRGEAMLRHVLEKDPRAFSTRLTLARLSEERGERENALAFAARALEIANEQGRADKVAEAQAVLAELSREH
ncbi:MAG: hypothetical protein U0807_14550 [Candidatus Binatia bacterium]